MNYFLNGKQITEYWIKEKEQHIGIVFKKEKYNMFHYSDLIDDIARKIYKTLNVFKIRFENNSFNFNEDIKFYINLCFFDQDYIFREFKKILDFKTLCFEDFIYCSLEEIVNEIKICLKYEFNKIGEKYFYNSDLLKYDIFYEIHYPKHLHERLGNPDLAYYFHMY